MSGANFYEILGIKRSASSDEIRAAFRELVKRHHPDLFSTSAQKQQATEKLSVINEAYATLGNPQRRREYDQSFAPETKERPRARAPGPSSGAVRPQRKQARPRREKQRRNPWRALSKKRLVYALGAVAAIMLLIYAVRGEPRWTTAWTLVQKVEISSAAGGASSQSSGPNWSPVAHFKSVADCAGALKEKVREDEREGSKAVLDERSGMMAITVYLKKASAGAGNAPNPNIGSEPATNSVDDSAGAQSPSQERTATVSDGAVKRVRNLECRATRRLETESWARRTLRDIGLSF